MNDMHNMTQKEMVFEAFLTLKSIRERQDRHSIEYHADMDKIWHKLESIADEHNELAQQYGDRLTKLETEKNTNKGYFSMIASFLFGGVGAWMGRHL